MMKRHSSYQRVRAAAGHDAVDRDIDRQRDLDQCIDGVATHMIEEGSHPHY